jgi:hypothetical protein
MSITQKVLATVQKAGNAVHDANDAVDKAAKAASMRLMATMNSQQLSGSADREFARWKSIARVLEELQEVEVRMVDIYQRLGSMVEAETEVLVPLPRLSHQERMVSSDQSVVDVESKPASTPVTSRTGKKAKHTLSRNDKTMMKFLTSRLNRKAPTALRQRDMSAATGIPPGSIGGTIARLVKNGLITEPSRGTLQLR